MTGRELRLRVSLLVCLASVGCGSSGASTRRDPPAVAEVTCPPPVAAADAGPASAPSAPPTGAAGWGASALACADTMQSDSPELTAWLRAHGVAGALEEVDDEYTNGCCAVRIGTYGPEALLCDSLTEHDGHWLREYLSLRVPSGAALAVTWHALVGVERMQPSRMPSDPLLRLDVSVRADGTELIVGRPDPDHEQAVCEETIASLPRRLTESGPEQTHFVAEAMRDACASVGAWHLSDAQSGSRPPLAARGEGGDEGRVFRTEVDLWLRAHGVTGALPRPAAPAGMEAYGGGCEVARLGENAPEVLVCRSAREVDREWVQSYRTILVARPGGIAVAWHGPTGVRLMEPAYAAALLSGDGPADAVRLWPLMSADGTTLTFEETTDRDPACAPASAPAPRARGPRRRGVDRAVAETCQSLGRWTAHDGVFARATP